MAGGARDRRAQRDGRFRCAVDQLFFARDREGLGRGQGHAGLGSLDGIGGHGDGVRAGMEGLRVSPRMSGAIR